MLTVVTVNWGNYLGRGQDYVDRLYRGVKRNLLVPFAFHVITEKDTDAEGWWAKLAMFQPGKFEGRCIGIDLDTIITGNLDHVAGYRGPFAGLSDFYHPHQFASGVMMWEAGVADHIWTKWVEAGKPTFHPGGDGSWVGQMMPKAERLQTLYPGQFVSFKKHCVNGLPDGARMVCFHGNPRPHMMRDLMAHWGAGAFK